MVDGQKNKIIGLTAALVVAGSLGLHGASPAVAEPKPDISSVKAQVDRLYRQAEIASERFNGARDELTASQVRLRALDTDLRRQQRVVSGMRDDVASLVVQQYQGQVLSTASQLVFSDNPDTFVDNLNAASSFDSQRGRMMASYATQLTRLQLRQRAADTQVAALGRTRAVLAAQKSRIDEKAAAAKKLLGSLQEKQRLALLARSAQAARAAQAAKPAPSVQSAVPAGAPTSAPANVPTSGRAGAAVRYALAQVGDGYVWGATGPSAFDCSGLTMMSWAQAGVSLPHQSGQQMATGRPVAKSDLQPGDLVFYYSPVSHVSIYIGNGMTVSALNPGEGVKVVPVDLMPYSGAVRPG